MVVEADGIAVIDIVGSRTTRLPHRNAQAIAGFDDQLWIVGQDGHLVRVDPAGRPLGGTSLALPCTTTRGVLISAPCGPAVAVWSTAPPVTLLGEIEGIERIEHPHADVVLPLVGRRCATAVGSRLILPSGQVTQLAPNSMVLGGVAMSDGKRLALLVATTGASGASRQLVIVSLTMAQIVLRCAIQSTKVRIATERGLAIAQLEPRVFWGIDLRSGRELGIIALDRDVAEHAIDPAGQWLAVRNATGEVELLSMADAVRAAAAIGAIPTAGSDIEAEKTVPNPMTATACEIAGATVEFTRKQCRTAPARERALGARVPPAPQPAIPVRGARTTAIAARGRFAHGRFLLPTAAAHEITLRSAADQRDVIGVFPCGVDDADDTVRSAAGALADWAGLTVDARIAVLRRIEPALRQRLGELSAILERELGRPAWECQRELEGLLPRMDDLFAHASVHLGRPERTQIARTHHRPLGVVAILSPVMLPIATSHHHIVAALVMGNAVVWKPSPLVAASAQIYVEILHAAGLPAGVINLVQGDATVGQELAAHPRVDAVVFVGRREHARELRRATADRLDLTTIWHVGCKNPAVVLDGADLDRAAAELVQAAFLTAGQRCTAVSRVLVQRELLDPLLEMLVAKVRRLPSNFLGPMFSRERRDQFFAGLAAAEAEGASAVLRPGTRPDSLYVTPSIHVVTDRDRAVDYLNRELFGPDIAVEPVTDLTDATARLRGHGALFASLFAGDPDSWRQFQRDVDAGALLWNHGPVAVSGRLSFAARGMADRGAQAVLVMTRRTVRCDTPTGAGLPFNFARPPEPVLACVQGGRS